MVVVLAVVGSMSITLGAAWLDTRDAAVVIVAGVVEHAEETAILETKEDTIYQCTAMVH